MNTIILPKITNTDPANADTFNRPLNAIEAILNEIHKAVNTVNTKEGVVVSNVPVSSDTKVGDFVYIHSSGEFRPAVSRLDSVYGVHGEPIEAPESRVVGMIVSKNAGTGNLLIGGKFKDYACVSGCLGASPELGVYYLSDTDPGKCTNRAGKLIQQPVLVYMGDDTFIVNALYQTQTSHYHTYYTLMGTWQSDGSGSVYDIDNDPGLTTSCALVPGVSVVFHNGAFSTDFTITNDGIRSNLSPANIGSVTVFSALPAAQSSSVVRGISVDSPVLNVESSNGIVTISHSEYTQSDVRVKSNVAISNIQGNTLNMSPMVSDVKGIGIRTEVAGDGTAYVYSPYTDYTSLYASEYNLNGCKRVSDDLYTYVVFPKLGSSVTIARDITDVSNLDAFLNVWVDSVGDSDKDVKFNISIYYMPTPNSDGVRLPSAASPVYQGILDCSLRDGYTIRCSSTNDSSLSTISDGTIFAKITLNTDPTSPVRILRAGFSVDPLTADQNK